MPRPTETMTGAAVRSTVWADSRNGAEGVVRICAGVEVDGDGFDGRGCVAASSESARKAPAWMETKHGACSAAGR